MGILDWINFGLGVANTAANISTARKLEQMKQQGATEAVLQIIITELRNIVFDSRKRLKALEMHIETDPMPVYALARTVEARLQNLGITPRAFQDLKDMEFVEETLEQLERVMQSSRNKLDATQVLQAENCAQALTQMPLLIKAIDSEQAQEELLATQPEWSSLSSKRTRTIGGGCATLFLTSFVCPISPTAVFCAYPIMGLSAGIFGGQTSELGQTVGALAFVGFVVLTFAGIGGSIILWLRSSSKEYSELKLARENMKKKVVDNETQQVINQTFGKNTKDQYLRMKEEREGLIQTTLSGLADNPLLA